MINPVEPRNRGAFIRTSRHFPVEIPQLVGVLNKNHIEIALAINARIIGDFEPVASTTGERWLADNNPVSTRQTFRKIFYFNAINAGVTLNIPHELINVDQITRFYGTCDTASDKRPIPYVSVTAVNAQIEIRWDITNIIVTNGSGSPNILRGIIILEYLLKKD